VSPLRYCQTNQEAFGICLERRRWRRRGAGVFGNAEFVRALRHRTASFTLVSARASWAGGGNDSWVAEAGKGRVDTYGVHEGCLGLRRRTRPA